MSTYRTNSIISRVNQSQNPVEVDSHFIEVFIKLKSICNNIRKSPHPVLLECQTFRMRGHEEASGVKYVPKEGKRLDKMYKVTKKLAARMFPLDINPITKALKMFRKFCSPLNKAINILNSSASRNGCTPNSNTGLSQPIIPPNQSIPKI